MRNSTKPWMIEVKNVGSKKILDVKKILEVKILKEKKLKGC